MRAYDERMHEWAIFLRGINVGGIRIKMADLKRSLQDAGYEGVVTLLASGNVVVGSPEADPGTVKSHVEGVLREAFGYEAWVVVKSRDEVAAIVADYPFEGIDDGVQRHDYVVMTTGAEVVSDLEAEIERLGGLSGDERARAHGDVLFWQVPRGVTLDSVVSKATSRARFKASTTTRNLNTMHKALAAMGR